MNLLETGAYQVAVDKADEYAGRSDAAAVAILSSVTRRRYIPCHRL